MAAGWARGHGGHRRNTSEAYRFCGTGASVWKTPAASARRCVGEAPRPSPKPRAGTQGRAVRGGGPPPGQPQAQAVRRGSARAPAAKAPPGAAPGASGPADPCARRAVKKKKAVFFIGESVRGRASPPDRGDGVARHRGPVREEGADHDERHPDHPRTGPVREEGAGRRIAPAPRQFPGSPCAKRAPGAWSGWAGGGRSGNWLRRSAWPWRRREHRRRPALAWKEGGVRHIFLQPGV
jgi:hypothetical protein